MPDWNPRADPTRPPSPTRPGVLANAGRARLAVVCAAGIGVAALIVELFA